MNISPDDFNTLKTLEESLWRPETRFDPAYMERVLARDFFEFGRSGRSYTRADALLIPSQEIRARLPLEALNIQLLAPTVALVTYISEVQYHTLERANRSSIWVKNPSAWQLHFHQGTPA